MLSGWRRVCQLRGYGSDRSSGLLNGARCLLCGGFGSIGSFQQRADGGTTDCRLGLYFGWCVRGSNGCRGWAGWGCCPFTGMQRAKSGGLRNHLSRVVEQLDGCGPERFFGQLGRWCLLPMEQGLKRALRQGSCLWRLLSVVGLGGMWRGPGVKVISGTNLCWHLDLDSRRAVPCGCGGHCRCQKSSILLLL